MCVGPRAVPRPTLGESPGVSGGRGPLGAGSRRALLLPCALLSSQSASTRRAERGLERPTRKPRKHKWRDTALGYSAEKVKLETRAAWFRILWTLPFHPHFPRPPMRGSFYSLSVASLAGALWKLRLTRGRQPGGASATAAPAPRHALSGPGERGDSDTCGRWTSPSTLDSSMSANTLQLKWTER